MQSQNEPMSFSLGVEELSLALGLINRPDLGRTVLAEAHEGITEESADAYLTSAAHSMLARGFCSLPSSGSPILDKNVEQALFLFDKYDYLLNISLIRNERQVNTIIRVQNGKSFTSQFVRAGVVHVIEHDDYQNLPKFLEDALEGFAQDQRPRPISWDNTTVTLGLLGKALEAAKTKSNTPAAVFIDHSWTKQQASMIVEDLQSQTFRASLLRFDASSQVSPTDIKAVPQRTMLLLKGAVRSWVFQFPSTADVAVGTVDVVSLQDFHKLLTAFVM